MDIIIKHSELKTWKHTFETTGICGGSIITIQHILAIIFYTDDDILCYKFRKSFRVYDDKGKLTKDSNNIIYDHNEYGNWGKLLRQSVEVFGKNSDTNDEYYHGLNKRFIFKDILCTIHGGMVLTLKQSNEIGYCLSVKLFSRFSNEDEVLFFSNAFIINDIFVDHGITDKICINNLMKGYTLLHCILNGKYFDDYNDILLMSNQEQLIKFIEYILSNNDNHNNIYFNYFKLCCKKMMEIMYIHINTDYILSFIKSKQLHPKLSSLLFDIKYNNNTINPGIFIDTCKLYGFATYNSSAKSLQIRCNIADGLGKNEEIRCTYTLKCFNNKEIKIVIEFGILKYFQHLCQIWEIIDIIYDNKNNYVDSVQLHCFVSSKELNFNSATIIAGGISTQQSKGIPNINNLLSMECTVNLSFSLCKMTTNDGITYVIHEYNYPKQYLYFHPNTPCMLMKKYDHNICIKSSL